MTDESGAVPSRLTSTKERSVLVSRCFASAMVILPARKSSKIIVETGFIARFVLEPLSHFSCIITVLQATPVVRRSCLVRCDLSQPFVVLQASCHKGCWCRLP